MNLNDTDIELLSYMFMHGYTTTELLDIFKISRKELQSIIKSNSLVSPYKNKKQGNLYFCFKCRSYKTKEEFYKSKRSPYCIQPYCIPCKKTYRKKKDTVPQVKSKREIAKSDSKYCPKCKKTKDIELFSWSKKYKSITSICKECDCNRNKNLAYKLLEKRGY